jgi:hypothetical protein
MIKYQFPEEKEFILFFANKLSDDLIIKIINEERILTKEDAKHFSYFYWKMVDLSIELEKNEIFPWSEGSEFWCEKVSHSIGGFLGRAGFGDVWDDVANEQ